MKMKRKPAIVILVFLAMLLLANGSYAQYASFTLDVGEAGVNVIYVDNQLVKDCVGTYSVAGRDCSGTEGTAYTSIQKAADIVRPGDNVLIRGGTYNGRVDFRNGGTEGSYIVFKPYNNEEVVIQDAKTFSNWKQEGNYYTLISNASELGTNAEALTNFYSITLIKKEGYGISRTQTLNELDDSNLPDVAKGIDLFYADTNNPNAIKIYLKLISGNPNTDIYIAGHPLPSSDSGASTPSLKFTAPYIELNSLNVLYGTGIELTVGSGYNKIINCKIMHQSAKFGIFTGGSSTGDYIINNTIMYIGTPVKYPGWKTPNPGERLEKNGLDHCLYLQGPNNLVEGNLLDKSQGTSVHPWSGGDPSQPHDIIIRNNYIKGGIVVTGNGKIYNNIILPNENGLVTDYSVTLYDNSAYEIYNNQIIGTNGIRMGGGIASAVSSAKIKNNIVIINNGDGDLIHFMKTNLSKLEMSNNLYYNPNEYYFRMRFSTGGTLNPGDVFSYSDPYFEYMHNKKLELKSSSGNPLLNTDYSLRSGSPAIDAGVCIDYIETDFEGKPRPQGSGCDIGPYEFSDYYCGDSSCDSDKGETNATCSADCPQPQECVDNEKLVGYYIPQWKSGEISMLALMQKIRQRNAGTGCTPA